MRLFDLLHIGCGHFWQWNSESSQSSLNFTGKKAWEIGSKAYNVTEDEEILQNIKNYEYEAGNTSKSILELILIANDFEEKFQKDFKVFYQHFCESDLHSLLHFCKNGEVVNILD